MFRPCLGLGFLPAIKAQTPRRETNARHRHPHSAILPGWPNPPGPEKDFFDPAYSKGPYSVVWARQGSPSYQVSDAEGALRSSGTPPPPQRAVPGLAPLRSLRVPSVFPVNRRGKLYAVRYFPEALDDFLDLSIIRSIVIVPASR